MWDEFCNCELKTKKVRFFERKAVTFERVFCFYSLSLYHIVLESLVSWVRPHSKYRNFVCKYPDLFEFQWQCSGDCTQTNLLYPIKKHYFKVRFFGKLFINDAFYGVCFFRFMCFHLFRQLWRSHRILQGLETESVESRTSYHDHNGDVWARFAFSSG